MLEEAINAWLLAVAEGSDYDHPYADETTFRVCAPKCRLRIDPGLKLLNIGQSFEAGDRPSRGIVAHAVWLTGVPW